MAQWLPLVTALVGFFASSGFWAYLVSRKSNTKATTKLLLGLAYKELTSQGMTYIERGWVTREEYEDFCTFLYEPYKAIGGNGVGDQIFRQVSDLKFKSPQRYSEIPPERRENLNG